MLVLDVVGSTALTRQLDPEDVLEIMDGALQRFAPVVAQHGGRVLQYAGDSVLAAFGADAAREDDAERAVHAVLALLATAREHAVQVQQQHGHAGFDVRVGVHTGHVLLGGGVDEEGTIRGFTVNIAARRGWSRARRPGLCDVSGRVEVLIFVLFCTGAKPIDTPGLSHARSAKAAERPKDLFADLQQRWRRYLSTRVFHQRNVVS